MYQSKSKPYVDIFKFIFSICIVLLHNNIFSMHSFFDPVVVLLINLAVPYFFVASGYFLAEKVKFASTLEERKSICFTYIKRLAIKLLIFEPISIVLWLAKRYLDGLSVPSILLLTLQDILVYPKGALWYIQALIVAVLLLMPFILCRKTHHAIIPALVLFVLSVLGNRYYFLIENTPMGQLYLQYEQIFLTTRNGLFVGLPFVLSGYLISLLEPLLTKSHRKTTGVLVISTLFFFGTCCAEYTLIRPYTGRENALYFSYIALVPVFFTLSAHFTQFSYNTKLLRNLSTSIYLIHGPITSTVGVILPIILHMDSPWINASVVMVVIFAVCAIIYPKKMKPFYGWII